MQLSSKYKSLPAPPFLKPPSTEPELPQGRVQDENVSIRFNSADDDEVVVIDECDYRHRRLLKHPLPVPPKESIQILLLLLGS